MIDTSQKYWTGDNADDIDEYLREYSEINTIYVKSVLCRSCGSAELQVMVDQEEDFICVKCSHCGTEKILLDCEEVREEVNPKAGKCPVCRKSNYNVKVGFVRRENGSVKQVYIGNRCIYCGTLGSYLDWEIDYEPTYDMENHI